VSNLKKLNENIFFDSANFVVARYPSVKNQNVYLFAIIEGNS